MSAHHHRRHRHGQSGLCGVVNRVVNGLAEASGLGRGMVITGFVIGFVFVPLLTAIVFLVSLYWVSYPERARRQLEQASSYLRRTARRFADGTFASGRRAAPAGTGEGPGPPPPPSADDLEQRFDTFARRAKRIEEFVASEEYRLEREFKRMKE